jgi:hypothetical protein
VKQGTGGRQEDRKTAFTFNHEQSALLIVMIEGFNIKKQ